MTVGAPVQIESVPVAERLAALRFLLGEADPKDVTKFREGSPPAVGPQPGEGLFWARRSGQILAAVWAMPVPGSRTLQVTLPNCVSPAPLNLQQRMLRRLSDHLSQSSWARLAQIVLDPGTASLARAARQIGFRLAASLVWVASEPQFLFAPSSLQLRGCDAGDRPQLLDILKATFQDSLDCPALTTLLEPSDYLAAFEARCPTGHRDWYFVCERGQVVGCLLLGGLSTSDPVEVLYWGLIPEARGRRMGEQLLQLGQGLAGQRGKLLVACVDQANQPACTAFQRAGFCECGRQQLYIRPLSNQRLPAPGS